MRAVQCNRCKQLRSSEKCKERWFRTSFNEVLCDECLEDMLRRGTIEKSNKEGMYQYDFEKLLSKTFENERIIERCKAEIKLRQEKNKRIEKICKKLRPDLDF